MTSHQQQPRQLHHRSSSAPSEGSSGVSSSENNDNVGSSGHIRNPSSAPSFHSTSSTTATTNMNGANKNSSNDEVDNARQQGDQQQQQSYGKMYPNNDLLMMKSVSPNTAGGESKSGEIAIIENDENQLSNDLALFLSNPSLSSGLVDGSLDLASYSNTIETELYELEVSCINVYRTKRNDYTLLRNELNDCQIVLSSLHEMLLGFQADLGGLSSEIRQLQDRSRSLDVQLRNRKQVEQYLRDYLQQIIIPPNLTNAILDGPVNNVFLQAIQELQNIHKACHTSSVQTWACNTIPVVTKSVQEMQTIVKQLRLVALKRVREYFLQQMALLRQPQTNIRMIQIHGLLKYNVLHDFLEDSSPNEACRREIYNVYMDSMNKTLSTLFRTYQLQLLHVDVTRFSATRYDVIAIEDALLRDTLTTKAKKRYDVFCLGNRMQDCFGIIDLHHSTNTNASTAATTPSSAGTNKTTAAAPAPGGRRLIPRQQQQQPVKQSEEFGTKQQHNHVDDNNNNTNNDSSMEMIMNDHLLYSLQQQTPILAHVAMNENKKFAYECLYRSLMGHLVDSVTNEHIFCRQFFKRDAFHLLFNNTLSIILEQLENYLFNCYDAICLLLMIKVTHCYRRIVRYRKIHSLDQFFDQITFLLWPRLKTIIDNHIRSIQSANATTLGTIDLHAHYVSRRMGEFCCSVLLILHTNNNTTNVTSSAFKGHNNTNDPIRRVVSGGGGGNTTPSQAHRGRMVTNTVDMTASNNDAVGTKDNMATTTADVAADDNTPASRYSATNDTRSGSTGDRNVEDSTPKRSGGAATTTATPSLSTSQSAGDKLLEDLSEMITSFVLLLERLSETHATQKKRTVFLINNLDHIVCIFQERRVGGCKELTRFVELLMQQREIFVEEELLATGFSKMIAFVQQTEAHIANIGRSNNNNKQGRGNNSISSYDINLSVIESLVLDFASNWKSNIEQINRNVLSYFSNFRNGMEILKQCLTQLLLYYTRFQDIIRKVYGIRGGGGGGGSSGNSAAAAAITKDLVSTNAILAEIKKYALAI